MTFERFIQRVGNIARTAGFFVRSVKYDKDKGLYRARMSDGSFITGNPAQLKLTLILPNGSMYMFE